MADLFSFVLTPEQRELIRQKQALKEKLEAVIMDAQRQLVQLDEWLTAIAKVTGDAIESQPSSNGNGRAEESRSNMTEAIEKIANTSSKPIPRKTLKEMLFSQGFPADRLGAYFYTAVHRLKENKRITVQSDGSIWRAASTQ